MKFPMIISGCRAALALCSCQQSNETGGVAGVEPVELDSKTFVAQVEEGSGVAMVDFWAEWCEPCKVVAKHVRTIATTHEGQLLVAKVDVDIATDVARRHEVESLPSVFFYKDGEKVGEVIGLATLEKLEAELQKHLTSLEK